MATAEKNNLKSIAQTLAALALFVGVMMFSFNTLTDFRDHVNSQSKKRNAAERNFNVEYFKGCKERVAKRQTYQEAATLDKFTQTYCECMLPLAKQRIIANNTVVDAQVVEKANQCLSKAKATVGDTVVGL